MTEPHAISRARERYGIELTVQDLNDLAKRCLAGEGLLETVRRGIRYHALIWGERVLWLVYELPPPDRVQGDSPRWGTIITVMPPVVGQFKAGNDYERMVRRKGQWNHARRRR